MRHQEARTIIALPLSELEGWLARVEAWPLFLIGLESVEKLGHERYRFKLADGRDRRTVTACVRHRPGAHKFSWRALEGPSYTGCLCLQRIDERHTSVRLAISSHPGTLRAGLVEMLISPMNRAAHDLQNLEEHVLEARG